MQLVIISLLCVIGIAADSVQEQLLLNTTVTIAPQPRIVGGTSARQQQFPHQISLRERNQHVCGGAIISRSYVVTAAHCVRSRRALTNNNILSVQAGSLRLNGAGQIVRVAEIRTHPRYGSLGGGFDVALLRLSTPLQFGSNVAAIGLASSDPPNNAIVQTSGWGTIRENGPLSNDLLFVNLRAISQQSCRRFVRRLSESVICLLHNSNEGVCSGDSGGPAVYNGQLIGITSFSLGSCGRAAPDGFTRITAVRSWLLSNAQL